MVVYDGWKELENIADYAGLIAEVQNGKITPAGIQKIITALTKMKIRAKELDTESVYAFATASLRSVEDKAGLVELIKAACGIEIEIISAEEEAHFDYLGLKAVNDTQSGIAFDLGGGSCQLVAYDNNGVIESGSFSIGSLKLHTMFVSGVLPDADEMKNIVEYVRQNITQLKAFSHSGYKDVYAMGGAVFALCKLNSHYFGGNACELLPESFQNIMRLDEESINAVVPQRVKTIIPAAATMNEIIKYSSSNRIIATSAGVRDGILYKIMHP